jgi:peptide/nickel transport system substrate-binding protein
VRRWPNRLALVIVLALTAAACGSGGDDDTGDAGTGSGSGEEAGASRPSPSDPGEECTEDRVGGEVTVGVSSPITGVDPTVVPGSGYTGAIQLTALFDTLLMYEPDTGEFVPNVAESFEFSDDLTEWTITLREGITFGNGDPLTTEAVRYSFERMQGAEVSSAGQANQVAEMEIVDDLTMVFHLREPTGDFAYTLSEDVSSIVNPNVVEAAGDEAFNSDSTGGGVGPYELESFVPGEELVLTAKDNYWGGPVCIETLRLTYVPGGEATYEAFQAGELDVAFLLDSQPRAQAQADGVQGYSNVSGATNVLLMNAGIGGSDVPTDDVRLRRAIAYALDLEAIDERSEGGEGLPTSLLAIDPMAIQPDTDEIPFDPDESRELIAEVMDETGWDGRVRLLGGDTPVLQEMSIVIEALLESVGLEVEPENLPTEVVNERIIFSPDYDLALFSMSLFEESPMARLNQWYTDSPRSRTGFGDPAMDEALTVLQRAVTREEKQEAMTEVQEVWNETVPSAVLFAREDFIAYQDDVHGLRFSRDSTPVFHTAFLED